MKDQESKRSFASPLRKLVRSHSVFAESLAPRLSDGEQESFGTSFLRGLSIRAVVALAAFALACVGRCSATSPAFGDILITDPGSSHKAVYCINRLTGETTVFSGPGVGTGPALVNPHAIAVCPDGTVLVSDTGTETIVRIDPVTRNRTTLSIPGASFINVYGLAVSASGQIFMADIGTEKISTCSATGGNYSVLCTLSANYNNPAAISLDSTATYLWVADSNQGSGTKPATVSRLKTVAPTYPVTVSGNGVGSGPAMKYDYGIAQASDSSVYVCDYNLYVLLVDANANGARTVVSGGGVGSGPTITTPIDLTADPTTGRLLMLDNVNGNGYAILDVDPATGNRTAVPFSGTFQYPARMAVYGYYMDTRPPLVFSGNTISWPALATNWVLQNSPSLNNPTWANVTTGVSKTGASFVYSPSLTGPAGYYRLLRTN